MINKEIILNADGTIKKDFSDRAIPQNSNNQVSVNVLIPSTCFVGLQNYAVILAVSRIISNVETTLNTLVMSVSKSITIDGVVYVKYTAYLSSAYTDKIGQLKFSPYIQTTATVTEGGTTSEVISIQQSFTNSNLNVIKSVLPQYDASLEEGNIASTIIGMVEGKKIYTFIDDATSDGEHYYNLVDGFNPGADQFKGCLVVSVYNGATTYIMPHSNDGVELLEITKDGIFNRISGVSYADNTYTYTKQKLSYTKSEIDAKESGLQNQIDALNTNKVDKTQKVNGHALSGDITLTKGDVGLGNVANYGVESATPSASGDQLYITSKAVYDALQVIYSALNGYATTSDLSAINSRLESVEAIIGSDSGDADSVINTLKEVIVVLNGLGEGASLLDLINAKANQSDLTALDNQINDENGIKDKVDLLSERTNAYMEIKNSLGTIDILTSDWEENTGDTNYPYKWELTNGYLEGAVNCIVVYSKDSDTSMLSATVGIDGENGKLIIYASELPTATISIEKIAVFNDLNAYINYSNEIVQQVNSNTSAISDINNVKLPQYLKQEYQYNKDGKLTSHGIATTQPNSSNISTLRVRNDQTFEVVGGGNFTNQARLNLKTDLIQLLWRNGTDASNFKNHELNIDTDGFELKYYDKTSGVANTHSLTFDANGDLKIDGNAVGGGGGGQKVIKVYHGVINQVPDEDLYYISQSDIEDNVVDLITGQPPTSYNQGDIVLEVNWNDEYNYVENMYVFNSISDGTWVGQSGDLILHDCNYINNGVKAKQLYQHNIVLEATYTIGDIRVLFIIEDENNTQYTTISDLKTAYYNKYGEIERIANGYSKDTTNNLYRIINTILYNHTNNVFKIKVMSTTGVVTTLDILESGYSASLSITDNPIAL